MNYRMNKGFTLIELMIVVAIIAILAGIALPSYQESIKKAKRADAKAALMTVAGAMERHMTEKDSYTGATAASTWGSSSIPKDGNANYTLTISIPTSTSYTLKAEGVGSMSDDSCLNFTLDNTGSKKIVDDGGTVVDLAGECW
jgi:type IV pilus assembly protein PilE